MTQPSIGRIVHYVGPADTDPPCAAAIITAVGGYYPPGTPADNSGCSLHAFLPTQTFEAHDIQQDEDHGRGTWHWPERTDT